MTDFDTLYAEFTTVRIGWELYSLVGRACRQVARAFPPLVYAGRESWDDDALQDLQQDVITTQLLGQGQLDYIFSVSQSDGDVERLMTLQVRRALARRRTRTVVDNLIDRARNLLDEAPFSKIAGPPTRFWLTERPVEHRDPTDPELSVAVLAVAAIPQVLGSNLNSRQPIVYHREGLATALIAVAGQLHSSFTLSDLRRIFEQCLTGLLRSTVDADVTQAPVLDRSALSLVFRETAAIVVRSLSREQARILLLKAANVADSEAAAALGVSRPTLAQRKHAAFAIFGDLTEGLDDDALEQVTALVLETLASEQHRDA